MLSPEREKVIRDDYDLCSTIAKSMYKESQEQIPIFMKHGTAKELLEEIDRLREHIKGLQDICDKLNQECNQYLVQYLKIKEVLKGNSVS